MKIGVLFSGGKDSALAALLLSPFAQIELVTMSFGTAPSEAASVACILGFPHITMGLEEALATATVDAMINDGYPNRGINDLHKAALERAATHYRVVADGTRRDDKAPLLNTREARSLEDRSAIDYVRPLLGYGRKAIDALVDAHLEVTYGQCCSFDYEVELRRVMKKSYGASAVSAVFPQEHVQSRVTGRKSARF